MEIFRADGVEIDVWVVRRVFFPPRADLQDKDVRAGAVLEMMAVLDAGLEARAIAGLQKSLRRRR